MNTTLGVLITYHDEGPLLAECLQSVLNQPEPPDEIVIHDDASAVPAAAFAPRSARILRSEQIRGPGYGRNQALQATSSEYVHFHDADDLFAPDWCLKVRRTIARTQADAVFTEVAVLERGVLRTTEVLGLRRLAAGEDLVRFCLQGAILPAAGTYRRRAVLAVGGYRESLWQSEDFDFHVRLAASGITYAVVLEPLVTFRVRPHGRSQRRVEVWTSAVAAIEQLAGELPTGYRPDLAEAAARAGSQLFRLGARSEARRAFKLAKRLGPPTFAGQRRLYRTLARRVGPAMAEYAGGAYRKLPGAWREYLASRGW